MLEFLRSLLPDRHTFGPWRTIDSTVFNGQRFTHEVRYCEECGRAQFRRTVEEAEEPDRTISKMLFEVQNRTTVGRESNDYLNHGSRR